MNEEKPKKYVEVTELSGTMKALQYVLLGCSMLVALWSLIIIF